MDHLEARQEGHGLLADLTVAFCCEIHRRYLANCETARPFATERGQHHDQRRQHCLLDTDTDWHCL